MKQNVGGIRGAIQWISVAALSLLAGVTGAQASGLIHTDGQYFKDAQGRPVLLRGINLSNASKVPPFHPLTDLSQLKTLHDLGFNNVRLLFIWEAFEPQMGQYNQDYLDELGSIVAAGAKLGMTTVIDFHMDGFSRYTIGGCGSGAPAWTIPPLPGDLQNPKGQPGDNPVCLLWNIFETFQYVVPTGSFGDSLEAFYSDRYGSRTAYLEMVRRAAIYFKAFPSVLGYDLLNEPWGLEGKQIAPVYEDAAKVIRAEDPNAILFIEPSVMVALGWSGTFLPKPTFDNFAYAPHDYDALALGMGAWLDCGLFINTNFSREEKQAREWGVPLYMGEFGASGSGGLFQGSLIKHYYKLFDSHFTSSAQWDYSPLWNPKTGDGWNHENMSIIDDAGRLRRNYIPRPYPAAVAGVPGKFKVQLDEKKKNFGSLQFEWLNDPSLGTTDFVFPPWVFADPSQIAFTSDTRDLDCAFHAENSTLSCASSTPGKVQIEIKTSVR